MKTFIAACLLLMPFALDAKTPQKTEAPSLLFAQTAMGGGYDAGVLRLKNLSRTTLYFTDRPQRVAGHIVTSDFFHLWSQGDDSFAKVPPNAVVSVIKDGKAVDAIVELKNPKPSGDSVVYEVKIIEGQLPRKFDSVTIFIDAAQSVAMGNLYQATAQALANAAHNATSAQQNANTILQATTTQGVALLYGVDTASTAVGVAQILAAGKK